jgi:hypothetical protein
VTAIPTLVPPPSGVLTRAWLTTGMFKAYPHWLDLDDLLPGGIAGVQDDVLADQLLAATDWAVGVLDDMPLQGHYVQGENVTAYVKGGGRAHARPKHVPIRALTAMSWGADPAYMMPVALPDPTMRFVDGRRVSWALGGTAGVFSGPAIQFGPRAVAPRAIEVTWSYVAGFGSALLSTVTAGDSSVTVDDPAGILPGDALRIYDPGQSEAVTVAASYVPQVPTIPATPTAIPLAAAAQHGHAAGTGITGMPRRALQSVIAYTVALLMRDDVSDEEPASGFGPAARTTAGTRGGAASGLVNDAYGWLAYYKPTMRS